MLSLFGCSAAANKRLGKDLLVVAAAPIQIPFATAADTFRVVKDRPVFVPAAPVILFHQALKHSLATGIHAVDVLYFPIAAIRDSGPLDLYRIDSFPFYLDPVTGRAMMVRAYCFPAGVALATPFVVTVVYLFDVAWDFVHPYGFTTKGWLIGLATGGLFDLAMKCVMGAFRPMLDLAGQGLTAPFVEEKELPFQRFIQP